MLNIIEIYEAFNIDYKTEHHKHTRSGWVNVECPFCTTDNPGYHLGFELTTEHFVCWKCGFHPIPDTLSELLHISKREAFDVIKQYGSITNDIKKETNVIINRLSFKLPSNSNELQSNHIKYLESRNFNPEQIIKEWGILGTGVYSKLSTGTGKDKKLLDYRFRIIIPFFWNSKIVSFDSRDITGKHLNKYQACPIDRETIPHKSILYGKQDIRQKTGIIVEGPTDVWRFGKNAFATSGIKYTPQQVRLIAKMFNRVPVVYDGGELQARVQADALVSDLRFRKVDSFRVDIQGDPGNMNQEEANYLIKQLL